MHNVTIVYGLDSVYRISTNSIWHAANALFLVLLAGYAAADAFPDHDNGPLTGIFGLPDSAESGNIVSRGLYTWRTSFSVASHNVDDTVFDEQLYVDGETSRFALTFEYGLANNLDVGIEIPYLWHQSGSLDSLIDEWHDIFGFPGGSRTSRERDQLEFLYSNPKSTGIALQSNTDGIGDVRLLAGLQLSKTENRSTALRFGIKLPTGEADKLLGSGGTDLSIGLASDTTGLWGNEKLDGFYRANITYLGDPDLLENRHNNFAGQVSLGLSYAVLPKLNLGLQSKLRSAVYDSDTESLGDTSLSLTFGGIFRVTDRHQLMISVGEDLIPGTVPDVTFQLAFGYATR